MRDSRKLELNKTILMISPIYSNAIKYVWINKYLRSINPIIINMQETKKISAVSFIEVLE